MAADHSEAYTLLASIQVCGEVEVETCPEIALDAPSTSDDYSLFPGLADYEGTNPENGDDENYGDDKNDKDYMLENDSNIDDRDSSDNSNSEDHNAYDDHDYTLKRKKAQKGFAK